MKRLLVCSALLAGLAVAQADSFTSSASSLASKSVGSLSDSLGDSSDSSGGGKQAAAGPYTVTRVALAEDGRVQLALAPAGGDGQATTLTLRLPQALVQEQGLRAGDGLHLLARPYGMAVARTAEARPFFLAVHDPLLRDFESRKI
ncbi:hypothetical protein [Inhella sp.]|uniref:hypothetical protein n=1 Tax=Inhella sp. TaxID=1921806 RepID=UPI0035B2CFB4